MMKSTRRRYVGVSTYLLQRSSSAPITRTRAVEALEGRIHFAATSITEFPLPLYVPAPHEFAPARMAVGADGNLWFGGNGPPFTMDRITPSGVITEFNVPKIPAGISENSYGAVAAGP